MKNIYLPGTNKNVGYLNGTTIHVYKRFMKYLPWNATYTISNLGDKSYPFILILKTKKTEEIVKVDYMGWITNVDLNTYDFYDCTFKIPDNLDVIEMAYLYKNWYTKKKKK